jgi:hypothetical protein
MTAAASSVDETLTAQILSSVKVTSVLGDALRAIKTGSIEVSPYWVSFGVWAMVGIRDRRFPYPLRLYD